MKIPKARKLPSGSWFIQLRLQGESIPIIAETEAKCQAQAMAIKSGMRTAPSKKDGKTLRAAIDDYIKVRQNTLSPSTIEGYRRIQKNRFQTVMDKKLRDISNWQRICDREAKLCSAKTLRNAYRFIVSVLADNDIKAERVTLPQVIQNPRPWLEPDEVKTLVAYVEGKPEALPVYFALHSLRRSEIMGLKWENIDLKKGTITVQGSKVMGNQGEVYKATNKNSSSARTIPIMIPALKSAVESVEKKAGFIMTCHTNYLCEQINRACRGAGVPEVGTHGLRHSFASLAYHLGMSEIETMELGGWSDASTMRKIYTHLAAADRLKAENKLKSFFNC